MAIQVERIQKLNDERVREGRYVLYWMQASQRAEHNHALEYAILRANRLHQPLVAYFGLTDRYPEANERHYAFMLEGLREARQALSQRGIETVVLLRSPDEGAVELSEDASLLVTDRGYLKPLRAWRERVAESIGCPMIQVETDAVVPVETASEKEEYSAATLRPKLGRELERFLVPVEEEELDRDSLGMEFESIDIEDPRESLERLDVDRSVRPVENLRGGASEAEKHLESFLEHKMDMYHELRNDPTLDYASNLSPYLHYGQTSPLYVALRAVEAGGRGSEAFLEELAVRRELSLNFVFYNPRYDSFDGLPEWARRTLREHGADPREYAYTLGELEGAETHDPYWNSAQREMALTGKMHGYMRMYWGKKILEWTEDPEEAFRRALYLNNRYSLDGRDPNSYAGVAWCFGKHDRPWRERPIFGKVRYMSGGGLERKFKIGEYVDRIGGLNRSNS